MTEKLPRIETTRSGYPEHIPLVEQVQPPRSYADVPARVREVAGRLLAELNRPNTCTRLTVADVAALGVPPASVELPPGERRLERDKKLATLLALLFEPTGVEWSVDRARAPNGELFYAIIRGERNEVPILEMFRNPPGSSLGPIAHVHPDGTPEPSFGDLQAMARVRPGARELGFEPDNDDIIVANNRDDDTFRLIRYEHCFR